jgi:tetratricopeptide (TPR) repeat protein
VPVPDRRWGLASLLVLAGCTCGGSAPETTAIEEATAAPETAPREGPAPETPIAIGWDHLPGDPARAARAANAEALRLHGEALGAGEADARRIYEGSLAAFERVVEADPDYLSARFNVACALSRLGRASEAVEILRALLTIDYPGFAPRIDADPDLGPLAATPAWSALAEHRRALEARWDEALAAGVPVVHVTPREEIPAANEELDVRVRRTMQAGVWLARERRFVPMAPRLVQEVDAMTESLMLGGTVVDPARHAVLSFEGEGSWSEGGGPIGGGTFVVYDAGRGTERARFVSGRDGPRYCPPVTLHATDDGGAIAFLEEVGDEFVERTRVIGGGAHDALARPQLSVSFEHASVRLPTWSPAGLAVDGDVVRLGAGGAEAPLPAEHHVWAGAGERVVRWAPRDEHSDWLLTAALQQEQWDTYHALRPALSIVGVAPGSLTAELVLSARTGIGAILSTEREAYAQIGDVVYRLTASTDPEALPDELRLIPTEPSAY